MSGHFSVMSGYLVTASHGGDSVQTICVLSPDDDYIMSDQDRRRRMHDAIRAIAFDRFGEGASLDVSWVKSKVSSLSI